MKFRFRLERMLHFVQLRESMKKMELASIRQSLEIKQKAKLNMENSIRKILTDSKTRMAVDLAWLPYETQQINTNYREILKLEQQIKGEQETLAIKQEELSRLSMRKKALESLREKRQKEFTLNQSRREQKTLDESYQNVKVRDKRD